MIFIEKSINYSFLTYHLTQDKIRRLLSEVIGRTFSLGAISQAQGKVAQALLWPALWTFVRHPDVPPTNNLVERAIRSLVLRRKISYVTCSKRGIHFVERMFSVAQTCRLQARSLMTHTLVAWFHQRAGPSLGIRSTPSL